MPTTQPLVGSKKINIHDAIHHSGGSEAEDAPRHAAIRRFDKVGRAAHPHAAAVNMLRVEHINRAETFHTRFQRILENFVHVTPWPSEVA